MKYSDNDRLIKILEKGRELQKYLQDNAVTRDDLINTVSLQWLVTTPLYNIGEHVYYLSDDFKKAHDNIPWAMISGLRHRLVHDYEGTNWNIIANVVFDDLPNLLDMVETLIQ
jgi:uncharacterized protein with HEPN domain